MEGLLFIIQKALTKRAPLRQELAIHYLIITAAYTTVSPVLKAKPKEEKGETACLNHIAI